MTITVYKSNDASAPVLSGQAGAMAGVLDACLVNGYGAKAAAGWATAFTGTNLRAYQPASGNRLYLALDDTGTTSCRLVGYEAMSAVSTGTGPFPTALQVSGGLFCLKSTTADATARPWMVIADATFAYVFTYDAQTAIPNTAATDSGFIFGDILSLKSGDAYGTILIASATGTGSVSPLGSVTSGITFVGTLGHYIPRLYTQTGTAQQVEKDVATRSGNSVFAQLGNDSTAPIFPDPITGGMTLCETFICENLSSTRGTRGKIPGLYHLQHNASSLSAAFTNQDTIAGTGVYAGTTYMLLRAYGAGSAAYCAIQITGTWA